MDIYVTMMRVDQALTKEQETALKSRLSQTRQGKIARLRYKADQRLSLGAGLLLDQGLMRYGLSERTECFGTVENGKPCLLHYPEIQFNLSHSGVMVMAAFSSCPVGCDVERRQKARMDVANRFFSQSEQNLLFHAETTEQQDHLFCRLWTLKESYLKVNGLGMKLPLDSFSMDLTDPPKLAGEDSGKYLFRECSVPGYSTAVCVKCQTPGEEGRFFFSFQNMEDML